MSTSPNTGSGPSESATQLPPADRAADMAASAEMRAYLAKLEAEDGKIGTRNRYLAAALAGGVLLLVLILWGIYRSTIGAYAIIDEIDIRQDPVRQGRLRIKFRVRSPGKVLCRRVSGQNETDVVDYFFEPCDVDRPWSWPYQPGRNIDLTLSYRGGLLLKDHKSSHATYDRADIVILMDTTESMDSSIAQLKQKCKLFSMALAKKAVKPRFALIGFGDMQYGRAIDRSDFTSDVEEFLDAVDDVERFEGVDPEESALDALEAALELPLDDKAIRRFYLVTDAAYHPKTVSGLGPEEIVSRLAEKKVLLYVFSRAETKDQYANLLGKSGRFQELEAFGRVLSQGRVLGD